MPKKPAPKSNITINKLAIAEVRRQAQNHEERLQIIEKKLGLQIGPRYASK